MPKVKYKYKNESEKVINNADNYKVEPGIVPNSATRWQVYGTYTDASDGNKIKMFTCIDQDTPNINLQERLSYAVLKPNSSNAVNYLTTSPGGGAVEASSVWIVKDDFNGQIRTWIPYATYLQRLAQNPYYPQPGFILGWGGGSYTMYHWDKTTPGWSGGLFIVPNRVYKVVNPQVIKVHPANGTPNYTLKIFNGSNQIFSRTELYAPQYVEIIPGKQCPNNTCPVKCGDKVCCYGSDGISTENFLFSESIYQ